MENSQQWRTGPLLWRGRPGPARWSGPASTGAGCSEGGEGEGERWGQSAVSESESTLVPRVEWYRTTHSIHYSVEMGNILARGYIHGLSIDHCILIYM